MLEFHRSSIFLYNVYMPKEKTLQELQKLVSRYAASILYIPIGTEVDYNDSLFPLRLPTNNLFIPKEKNSNPFEWAADCAVRFKDSEVCILVPGTRFDAYGTRYGRGGGWYDRFLSRTPRAWLRIGVIEKTKMSPSKIFRQQWDEPVDWVMVHDDFSWSAYETKTRVCSQ